MPIDGDQLKTEEKKTKQTELSNNQMFSQNRVGLNIEHSPTF